MVKDNEMVFSGCTREFCTYEVPDTATACIKAVQIQARQNPSLKQEGDDEVLLSVYYLVHAGKGGDSCAGGYALRGVLHALQDGLIPISILAVLSEVRELREKGTYDAKRK